MTNSCSLVFAVLVAIAAFVSIGIGAAAYEWREDATLNRSIVEVSDSDETEYFEQSQYLFKYQNGSVGNLPLAVTIIEPLTDTASPPPGLDEWIQPGEVAASPAVANEPEIARYGEVSAIIDINGLGSASERFIYVRPASGVIDVGMKLGLEFGDSVSLETSSELLLSQPFSYLLLFQIGFLVIPALILVYIVSNLHAFALRRRQVLLEVQGMNPVRAWLVTSSPMLKLTLASVILAAGITLVICFTGLSICGFQIASITIQQNWHLIAGSFLVGVIATIGILFLATYPKKLEEANRVRFQTTSRFIRTKGWLAIIGFVSYTVFMWTYAVRSEWFPLFELASIIVVAILIRPTVNLLLVGVWNDLFKSASKRFSLVGIIAGRQGKLASGFGVKIVSLLCLLVFTSVQATGYFILAAVNQPESFQTQQTFRNVLQIDLGESASLYPELVDQFIAVLPEDSLIILFEEAYNEATGWESNAFIRSNGDDSNTTNNDELSNNTISAANRTEESGEAVFGSQDDDLSANQLVDSLINYYLSDNVVVTSWSSVSEVVPTQIVTERNEDETDIDYRQSEVVLVIETEDPEGDLEKFQTMIASLVKPAWIVSKVYDSSTIPAYNTLHQMRWIIFFGVNGITLLAISAFIRFKADLVAECRSLASLSAILGAPNLVTKVVRLRIILMILVLWLITALFTAPYAQLIPALGYATQVPALLLAVLLAVIALLGVVGSLVTPRIVQQESATWLPGRDT